MLKTTYRPSFDCWPLALRLRSYELPAAILILLSGIVACFAGYRLFRLVLAIYGFILGAMLASSLMAASNTIGMIGAALLGGIVGALIMTFAYFVGIALVGQLPPELNLAGYEPQVVQEVARHLHLYWSPQAPERKTQRHAVKSRLSVAAGASTKARHGWTWLKRTRAPLIAAPAR
mgnify:CR=1 FL=1